MFRALPFWKYEQTKSMIQRLASKPEALSKATLLRQREDIEEKNDSNILKTIQQAS